ncbi:MAG: BspA family leucine-rich repeat surface protein [Bacteroidota bacterium]
MKPKSLLFFCLAALPFFSCSSDDDKPTPPEAPVVQNNPPIIGPNQTFVVPENKTSDENIGAVEANDEDEDDTLDFSITGQAGPFTINSSTGQLRLAEGQSLDFETETEHIVTIEVSDGTDTDQETITVIVENVIDAPYRLEKSSFVLTVKTTGDNESVVIGTEVLNEDYDYKIEWGDDSQVEGRKGGDEPSHIYPDPGEYQIAINGYFPRIYMGNDYATPEKILSIDQWGAIEWKSFRSAFRDCSNLTYNASDAPDLSKVTDLAYMFMGASSFNGDLNNWNVSKITTMEHMFNGASSFNSDLSNWTPTNVAYTGSMFLNASSFNGNVSSWSFTKLKVVTNMFYGASVFDQNLGDWNISTVTSMAGMLDNTKLSPENYSKTLVGWEEQDNTPSNITLGAFGLEYCGADAILARQTLTQINGLNWDIQDDEECPQQ